MNSDLIPSQRETQKSIQQQIEALHERITSPFNGMRAWDLLNEILDLRELRYEDKVSPESRPVIRRAHRFILEIHNPKPIQRGHAAER